MYKYKLVKKINPQDKAAGRVHVGIPEIDLSLPESGLVDAHAGNGLLPFGVSIFPFLLAYSLGRVQIPDTVPSELRGVGVHLCGVERGLRAVYPGLIDRRIDFIKRLSLMDERAFREKLLLENAVDLGPDFCFPERVDAGGELGLNRNRLWFDDHDGHPEGLFLLLCAAVLAGGSAEQ